MVRIGNADIRRCISGYIGYDIVVDTPVVRIQTDIYMNVRIQFLKFINGLYIYPGLRLVGIVFSPESDFILS